MKIKSLEWDEANVLHIALKNGITTQEAEEVFVISPLFKRTKKGHYAAFGRTGAGRFLVVVLEIKSSKYARVITAWDMNKSERRYYNRQING